jgi:hypothetical protein
MVAMHFIPEDDRSRIAAAVYSLCLTGSVVFLFLLYPFTWAGKCEIGCLPLCGDQICSVSGNWHIAWELPLNGLVWPALGYFIPAFLLPLLYGSWRFTLYQTLAGPLLASLLTDNINEWPAVWCLLSIGLLLLVVKSPIRKLLYIKSCPWWIKRLGVV